MGLYRAFTGLPQGFFEGSIRGCLWTYEGPVYEGSLKVQLFPCPASEHSNKQNASKQGRKVKTSKIT